ncbi:MAG: RDD family protein [Candidatus Methylomirabilales bacterium]
MEKLIMKRTSAFVFDGLLVAAVILVLPGRFWWPVALGYFLLRDALISGRSVGKFAVGLTVMDRERNACSILKSIVRNLFLLLPGPIIEFFVMAFSMGGRRLGDRLAKTQVIDTRPQVRGALSLLLALSVTFLVITVYQPGLTDWSRWERPRSWREVVEMEKLDLEPRLKHVYEFFGWGIDPQPEDPIEEAKHYIIYLRDGRKIEVETYWEKDNEIQYPKLGGIVGVARKHVFLIENTVDGTRKRY